MFLGEHGGCCKGRAEKCRKKAGSSLHGRSFSSLFKKPRLFLSSSPWREFKVRRVNLLPFSQVQGAGEFRCPVAGNFPGRTRVGEFVEIEKLCRRCPSVGGGSNHRIRRDIANPGFKGDTGADG